MDDAVTDLIRTAIVAVTANAFSSAAEVAKTPAVVRAREHLAKVIGREIGDAVAAPRPPTRKTREQMDAGLGQPYQEVVDALLWSRRDFIDSAYTAESAGALAELREATQEAEYKLRAMIDRLVRDKRAYPHYPPLKPLVEAYGMACASVVFSAKKRDGMSDADWEIVRSSHAVQAALDALYSANLNDR